MRGWDLAKSFGVVLCLGILSRVLGFLREAVLAALFGATEVTDAYAVIFSVPFVLFASFSTAITTVMIPIVAKHRLTGSKLSASGNNEVWTLFHSLLLLLAVVLVILLFAVDQIVALIAPGFTDETRGLARRLALIMFPGIVFIGLNGWMQAVYNSSGNFTTPAAAALSVNLILILGSYFLGRMYGIEAVAWISLLAMAAQVLLQWPGLRRIGLASYKAVLMWHDRNVLGVFTRSMPVLLGTSVLQLCQIIDRAQATSLPAGSAAALGFAWRLIALPLSTLVQPLVTVVYPELTARSSRADKAGFVRALRRSLRLVALLMVPITFAIVLLRIEIVRLVFERGRFTFNDTQLTASVLLFFALGLPAFAWRELLCRVLFSMGDARSPAALGVLTLGLNAGLTFLLEPHLDHAGIALATSLAMWVDALLLVGRLERYAGLMMYRTLAVAILQAVTAAVPMAVTVWAVRYYLLGDIAMDILSGCPVTLLALAGAITVPAVTGALVYGAVLWWLRIEEWEVLREFIDRVRCRLVMTKMSRKESQ